MMLPSRAAIAFALASLSTGCAARFGYPASSPASLKPASELRCVVLSTQNETDGDYQGGITYLGEYFSADDVQADSTHVVKNVLASANLCRSIEVDAAGGTSTGSAGAWDDAKRKQLVSEGFGLGARMTLRRMNVNSAWNWYVFINPLSLVGLLGFPTVISHDTTELAARVDVIDLATGDVIDSITPPTLSLERSAVWNGIMTNDINGALQPAWRAWGDRVVQMLQASTVPKLASLGSGKSAVARAGSETPPAASSGTLAGAPQPTSVAVIVGVEQYGGGLPKPTGARGDAERFAALATRTLGIPPENMKVALDGDATKATIDRHLAWATKTVPPGGRIYFYFSGHGAPDAADGTSYLVPSDGDPAFLKESALAQAQIYKTLAQSKAKDVVVLLDACFSGAGERSVLAAGARPLVRVQEAPVTAGLALFAASSGTETSGPDRSGKSGLFSATLAQALATGAADLNGDGQISLAELEDWTAPRVRREAAQQNRAQTPKVVVGPNVQRENLIVAWGLPTK